MVFWNIGTLRLLFFFLSPSGIEELQSKRQELNTQIRQEEEEKERLQHDIQVLSEKLSRVNESLSQRLAARAAFDRTIAETEAAYTKVRFCLTSCVSRYCFVEPLFAQNELRLPERRSHPTNKYSKSGLY